MIEAFLSILPPSLTHLLSEGVQNLHLHKRLMVEPLLIPDDLYGHWLIGFVIKALRKQNSEKA